MYLFYEHSKSPTGEILLTELLLSSGGYHLHINFKNSTEQMLFELSKTVLKFPPVGMRSYNPTTKIWSYFNNWGVQTIQKIQEVSRPIQLIVCVEVADLEAQAMAGKIEQNRKSKPPLSAEEFFYNNAAPTASPTLTKETVTERLKALLGDTLDKSAYRRAALQWHPDKNNGDGSKMSELNMLWRVYNA